jgi:hypothetical protein
MVTKELSKLGTVGRIFVDTELEVFAEGFVEFVEGIFVFGEVVEHFNALLDQVLLDDTKDLVLLEGLTGNVQWKICKLEREML